MYILIILKRLCSIKHISYIFNKMTLDYHCSVELSAVMGMPEARTVQDGSYWPHTVTGDLNEANEIE